jgi:hypothetical protein
LRTLKHYHQSHLDGRCEKRLCDCRLEVGVTSLFRAASANPALLQSSDRLDIVSSYLQALNSTVRGTERIGWRWHDSVEQEEECLFDWPFALTFSTMPYTRLQRGHNKEQHFGYKYLNSIRKHLHRAADTGGMRSKSDMVSVIRDYRWMEFHG